MRSELLNCSHTYVLGAYELIWYHLRKQESPLCLPQMHWWIFQMTTKRLKLRCLCTCTYLYMSINKKQEIHIRHKHDLRSVSLSPSPEKAKDFMQQRNLMASPFSAAGLQRFQLHAGRRWKPWTYNYSPVTWPCFLLAVKPLRCVKVKVLLCTLLVSFEVDLASMLTAHTPPPQRGAAEMSKTKGKIVWNILSAP